MFETPANMTLKRKNDDDGPQVPEQLIKRVALYAENHENHDSDASNTASIVAGDDTTSNEEGVGSEQSSSDDVNLLQQISDAESARNLSSKASSEQEYLPSADKDSSTEASDLDPVSKTSSDKEEESKSTVSVSSLPSQPQPQPPTSDFTRSPAYQPEREPAYQPKTSTYDDVVNERRRRSPVVSLSQISDPRRSSSNGFDSISHTVDAAAAISTSVNPSIAHNSVSSASSNGSSSSYPNGAHSSTFAPQPNGFNTTSTPAQKEQESDPTYVMFRMYCRIKEASAIVGKKGEKINHLRDKANVRINVSDNLEGVQERIVLVRGPAESVARAFGLIVRTILEEPEDEPASMLSKTYELKILVPHAMVGYIIGKLGSKFREIEENSAAQLKAAEQPLPFSTDRVLTVTGVGDAIHIAIYYILQVMIEHKDCFKRNKVIFYNPENARQVNNPMGGAGSPPPPGAYGGSPGNINSPYLNSMGGPGLLHHQNQSYQPQNNRPYNNYQQQYPPTGMPQQYLMGNSSSPASGMSPMGGMAIGLAPPPPPVPQLYTDDHGNIFVGEIITHPPQPSPTNPGKFNQDIFVANENIGSVIGKGGNNIKQIRLNSGCTYVKIEPDQHQQIMISGRGLTNIRKLTLTGSVQAIQMAVSLINQRISIDKERNTH